MGPGGLGSPHEVGTVGLSKMLGFWKYLFHVATPEAVSWPR